MTNRRDEKYWTEGSYDDWLAEMAGARLIVERFANITDGSVIGVRAPYLLVGANEQVGRGGFRRCALSTLNCERTRMRLKEESIYFARKTRIS